MTQHCILTANLEVLEQGSNLLTAIDKATYTLAAKPYFNSSIGQHFRHIIDIYSALIHAIQSNTLVNYENKARGSFVEKNHCLALEKLQYYQHKILSLDENILTQDCQILVETTIKQSNIYTLSSNWERELLFAASHAIHHFALITAMMRLANKPVSDDLGLAPSTVKFLKGQQQGRL